MNRKTSPIRTSIAVLGGIALSLTLVRCSPLSLSQSKLRASQNTTTPNPLGFPGTVKPIGGSALASEQTSALAGIPASVQEFSEYQKEIDSLPLEQRLTINADSTGDALEVFRSTRSIIIHFGGHPPDRCRAYLGLSMSELKIANYGWDNGTTPITVDCAPLRDGDWKISISPGVSLDNWTLLSPALVGVTIFAGNNPQMTVVGPDPSQPPSIGVHITPSN